MAFDLVTFLGVWFFPSIGSIAMILGVIWRYGKRFNSFFKQMEVNTQNIASLQKSFEIMNHNSNRLEKALIYAHVLKPEDFRNDP